MFGTRRDTQTIRPQPNIIRDGTPAYRAHLADGNEAAIREGYDHMTGSSELVAWPTAEAA